MKMLHTQTVGVGVGTVNAKNFYKQEKEVDWRSW